MDQTGAAVMKTLKFNICDCKSKDSNSQCLLNDILRSPSADVNILKCKCSKYYIGTN